MYSFIYRECSFATEMNSSQKILETGELKKILHYYTIFYRLAQCFSILKLKLNNINVDSFFISNRAPVNKS